MRTDLIVASRRSSRMPPRAATALAVVVAAAAGAGCLIGGDDSRNGDQPRARRAGASPRAFVLLADRRLVRVSLTGGIVESAVRLGAPAEAGSTPDGAPSIARLLASAADGATVFALVRGVADRADRVVVVDARTLRVHARYRLPATVRHTGLLVGASGTFYAYGDRRGADGRGWSVAVTTGNALTGAGMRMSVVRAAEPLPGVHWGALSRDERRLVLAYHGGVDGADWYRVEHGRFERCRPPRRELSPRGADRCLWNPSARGDHVHGAVAALRDGFLAATGSSRLIVLGRDGQLVRAHDTHAGDLHLMDIAIDTAGLRAVVGACRHGKGAPVGGGLRELHLGTGAVARTPFAGQCADAPLAIHGERVLLARPGRAKRLAIAHLGRAGDGTIVPGAREPVAGLIVHDARPQS